MDLLYVNIHTMMKLFPVEQCIFCIGYFWVEILSIDILTHFMQVAQEINLNFELNILENFFIHWVFLDEARRLQIETVGTLSWCKN